MGVGKVVGFLLLGSLLLGTLGCSTGRPAGGAAPSPTLPVGPGDPPPAQQPPQSVTQPPAPSDPTPPPDPDPRLLYPAAVWEQGARRWGYIGPDGRFVIAPRWGYAGEFDRFGLATVERDGKYGLINKDGREVLAPRYQWIDPVGVNGVRLAHDGESQAVIDYHGAVLFTSTELAGAFKSGLAPIFRKVGDKLLYGYVNVQGQVVIEPQYQRADLFFDGKAVVQVQPGEFAVLDPSGKRLSTLSYENVREFAEDALVYQDKGTKKFGYLSPTGEVLIPAQFGRAEPFDQGCAVVSASASFTESQVGLINRKGEVVIPLQFSSIERIGPGLYAVGPKSASYGPSQFMPKALMTSDGKVLTDFVYYDVRPLDHDVVSVTDVKSTFFLDGTGRVAVSLPALEGIGSMKIEGDLIRADIDGRVRYLTRDGRVVWQEDRTEQLAGGITVKEQNVRTGRFVFTSYPEFVGLPNPKAQERINQQVNTIFVAEAPFQSALDLTADGRSKVSANIDYAVQAIKNLLIVTRAGSVFPIGAAHGMPYRDYLHFDSQTGTTYTLADLFKRGSAYQERLQTLISQQIAAKPKVLSQDKPAVKPDQLFHIQPDRLVVYWRPYEIGPYVAGFPTFEIPYADIMDLIDTQGAFWKSFH